MTDYERNRISRRGFLGATGALGTLWVVGTATPAQALDRALKGTAARAMTISGTTLQRVAARVSDSRYTRLKAGAGWPLVVRRDITAGNAGRDDGREGALACFVQFTDVHVVDSESPVRFEYVHPFTGSAYRPHEVLSNQGTASLVRRVNSLIRQGRGGPFTGRKFDCLVSTGDNTDNKEHIELDWFFAAYNGGSVTSTTGDSTRYEGVQNSGVPLYWNPESSMQDLYKDRGFPQIPGLLTAARKQFVSPGLKLPWFSVFGNHDDSVEGTLPSGIPFFEDAYTGNLKIMGASSEGAARNLVNALANKPQAAPAMVTEAAGIVRTVTPDERRRPFTPQEYIAAHRADGNDGPGPHGHGFAEGSEVSGIAYYTFEIAPGVVGITMDSTNRIGLVDGSLGDAQFRWIEQTLINNSSRYFDTTGAETKQSVSDTYFVLFSHHTSDTMGNLLPDPGNLWEPRHSGPELVALLQRFPNVLAWVNGPTHVNDINPRMGPTRERSFWEINTASHIDYPQHARLLEIADNRDGTLSIFTTLIEAESPYEADYATTTPEGLASLYREFSLNDIHYDPTRLGAAKDHNTELLLVDPLPSTKRAARTQAHAEAKQPAFSASWW